LPHINESLNQQDYVSKCCCGDSVPSSCQHEENSSGRFSEDNVGTFPICNICGKDGYPGIPSEYVLIRYVGGFSCHDLYFRGLSGQIDDYMCGPVQDYVFSICGCGMDHRGDSSSGSDYTRRPLSGRGGPAEDTNFLIFVSVLTVSVLLFTVTMIRLRRARSNGGK